MASVDWGVRPMWPMTGISASTMASIIGRRLRPPSSFTDWAPARTSVAAFSTAAVTDVWYAIQGRSPTTNGLGLARATAATWWAMSATDTWRVSS